MGRLPKETNIDAVVGVLERERVLESVNGESNENNSVSVPQPRATEHIDNELPEIPLARRQYIAEVEIHPVVSQLVCPKSKASTLKSAVP